MRLKIFKNVNQVYMFNFGKPGGGYPSRPIPIILPNDPNGQPGERMNFWYYDEAPIADPTSHQWKIYGQGTVSQDGKTIVPDPGVGQPKFCCGASFVTRAAAVLPALGFVDPQTGGDPVLLATGQLSVEATDLVLPGRIPIVIRRAYRSQDVGAPADFIPTRRLVNGNAFGSNTALLEYDDPLQGSGQVLFYTSGFSQERLSLQADGTYRNSGVPTLAGRYATKHLDGTTELRDKDGTIRTFDPANGFLTSIVDRNGNAVTIVRSGTQIQQIIEPGGARSCSNTLAAASPKLSIHWAARSPTPMTQGSRARIACRG